MHKEEERKYLLTMASYACECHHWWRNQATQAKMLNYNVFLNATLNMDNVISSIMYEENNYLEC